MDNIVTKNKSDRTLWRHYHAALHIVPFWRFSNVLEAFVRFLHALLHYSCTLKCLLPSAGELPNDVYAQNFVQAQLPPCSCWNCSEIRRERLKEWGGRLPHTPRERWILFGLCLLSLSLANLVCYVGFYGEKHRPCQTWLVHGIKKKKKACAGTGVGWAWGWRDNKGNSIPRILRVWNRREKDAADTKSMCIEAKTATEASFVSHRTNREKFNLAWKQEGFWRPTQTKASNTW